MSINVTVHGNPISIKRGKMVAVENDKEFERRRCIRLQQVRQQSKEIAEDVRNRVKREKNKQLSKTERVGERDLKRLQARELLSLQEKYDNCLRDFGNAYRDAEKLQDEEELINQRTEVNRSQAEQRGKIASDKHKEELELQHKEMRRSIENRKEVRVAENIRSKLVASIHRVEKSSPFKKKKKRKKVRADITINGEIISDDNDTKDESVFGNLSVLGEVSGDSTPRKLPLRESLDSEGNTIYSLHDDFDTEAKFSPKHKSLQRSPLKENKEKKISKKKLSFCSDYPDECRISPSHRLCQGRDGPPQSPKRTYVEYRSIFPHTPERLHHVPCEEKLVRNQQNQTDFSSRDSKQKSPVKIDRATSAARSRPRTSEIPFVPTISVRQEATQTHEEQMNTVKYYDHFNRFSVEYNAPPLVHKISRDSLEVCPPTVDEEREYFDTMRRREEDARIRGNKALEKNKIHRDYQQLMEELPVLQRQERLASMRTHKQSFHMSDERLREFERKKQNRIESVFEKYHVKSQNLDIPMVTCKSVRKSPPSSDVKKPFRTLDITESPPVLNVGTWETAEETLTTTTTTSAEKVSEETTPSSEQSSGGRTTTSKSKEQTLEELIERVNRQRNLLLKEASNIPLSNLPLTDLKSVLNDKDLLKLVCNCTKTKILVHTATSPLHGSPKGSGDGQKKKKESSKRAIVTSSSDTSMETPVRKIKKNKSNKRQKILIKEEGTQTSPFLVKSEASIRSKKLSKKLKETDTQTSARSTRERKQSPIRETAVEMKPSDCTVSSDNEKLCEIIIKMRGDSDLQIKRTGKSCERIKKMSGLTDVQYQEIKQQTADKKVRIKIKEPQRNNLEISTSTSYMSPPDVTQKKSSRLDSYKISEQRSSYKELLNSKPQQTNIDSLIRIESDSKELNPRLVKYIQKLLTMSRQSIDDLTVSTVSDVSTLGASIVQSTENTAMEKLVSVMDHFNLSTDDIRKYFISSGSSLISSDGSMEKTERAQRTSHDLKTSDSNDVQKRTFSSQVQTKTTEQVRMLTSTESNGTDQEKYSVEFLKRNARKPFSDFTSSENDGLIKDDGIKRSTESSSYEKSGAQARGRSPISPKLVQSAPSPYDKDQSAKKESVQSPKRLSFDMTTCELKEQERVESIREIKSYPSCSTQHRPQSPKSASSGVEAQGTQVRTRSPKPATLRPQEYRQLDSPNAARGPKQTMSEYDEIKQDRLRKSGWDTVGQEQSDGRVRSGSPNREASTRENPGKQVHSRSPKSSSDYSSNVRQRISKSPVSGPKKEDSVNREEQFTDFQDEQQFLNFINQKLGMSLEDFAALGYSDMINKYMNLTEDCCERIISLTNMIEKVRLERRQICTPSPTDPSLTSYLDLPSISKSRQTTEVTPSDKKIKQNKDKSYDELMKNYAEINDQSNGTASSLSQEALDNYLLDIGMERSIPELKKKKRVSYQLDEKTVTESDTISEMLLENIDAFVPMLQGIPKYSSNPDSIHPTPLAFMSPIAQHFNGNKKSRPPPSILRSNIRNNLDVSPHELSTIIEIETVVSSRNTSMRPPGPDDKEPIGDGSLQDMKSVSEDVVTTHSISSDEFITISPERTDESEQDKIRQIQARFHKVENKNIPKIFIKPTRAQEKSKSTISGVNTLSDTSSNNTESPNDIETMLRDIGLDWAVAAMKKTEKALALSSSSSSMEYVPQSGQPVNVNISKGSLKEMLYKQCFKKTAVSSINGSGTENSQPISDISRYIREFQEFSEIHGQGTESRNKSTQRTSTPVQNNRSSDSKSTSKECLFAPDSELSSVKFNSDDNLFLSIPNFTLNTTNCSLDKSKK